MFVRQQSTANYPIPILLVSSADGRTPVSGVTPVVNLRKTSGNTLGSAATAAGTISASDSAGIAYLAGNATDRNTLGPLVVEATAAGADPVVIPCMIVASDPIGTAKQPATLAATDVTGNLPANVLSVGGNTALYNALAAILGTVRDTGAVPVPGVMGYDDNGVVSNGNKTIQLGSDLLADDGRDLLVGALAILAQPSSSGYAAWVSPVVSADNVAGTVTLLDAIPAAFVTAGAVNVRVTFVKSQTTHFALDAAYDPAKSAASQSSVNALPTANQNADALLKRDWTAVTGEAARSVLNALRFLRNKWSVTANPGNVRVYKEDDATTAYDKPITTQTNTDGITSG